MGDNDSRQEVATENVVYERVPFPRQLLEAGERVMSRLYDKRNVEKQGTEKSE